MAVPLALGPVTIRSGASLDLKVIRADGTVERPTERVELSVPNSEIAKLAFISAIGTTGVTIGELMVHTTAAGIVGGLAAWAWAEATWRRLHGGGGSV